jgi:hypothetical protein
MLVNVKRAGAVFGVGAFRSVADHHETRLCAALSTPARISTQSAGRFDGAELETCVSNNSPPGASSRRRLSPDDESSPFRK